MKRLSFYIITIILVSLFLPVICLCSQRKFGERGKKKKNEFNPYQYRKITSLSITPDSRGASMGDLGVATDPDANSQFWNPSKYAFRLQPSRCISIVHAVVTQIGKRHLFGLFSGVLEIGKQRFTGIKCFFTLFFIGRKSYSPIIKETHKIA